MSDDRWRILGTCYFVVQGLSCIAWWAWMLLSPGQRSRFFSNRVLPEVMWALSIGDVAIIALGSLAVAHGLHHGRRWAAGVTWLVAGACMYAALLAVTMWFITGEGALGAALMVPLLLVPAMFAGRLTRDGPTNPGPD
jgi:hypothetical protein